jgi:hypothetical protein
MGTLDKSGINTPFGRVFLDHAQGKVFLFAGDAPVEISDLGLFDFFRQFVNKADTGKYALGYDWENKRLLISNKNFKVVITSSSNIIDLDPIITPTSSHAYDIGEFVSNTTFIGTTQGVDKWVFFSIIKPTTIDIYFNGGGSGINLRIGDFLANVFYSSSLNNVTFESTTTLNLSPGNYYIFLSKSGVNPYTLSLKLPDPPNTRSISFYPKTQTWTSFHDFAPTSYLSLNRECFAFNSNSFWNLNNSAQVRKESYVTFVENTNPDAFKRFERIEMNTMSGGVNGIIDPGGILDINNYSFLNNSFSHVQAWNERQNTSELFFLYNDDYLILSDYYDDRIPVTLYKNSFHAELPFDSVVNANGNIFDPQNINLKQDFKSHMKSKFLYVKLSYKNVAPLVLNYVKTFFKPTVN